MKMLTLLAGAALSISACGTAEDETTKQGGALTGGQPTSARPEVLQFLGPHWTCTATMISPRTFVTAANCIDYAPHTTGGGVAVDQLGQIPVLHMFSQGGGGTSDDLAYGLLAWNAPVNPAQISTVEPSAGWLTALSYGGGSKNYVQYWYDGSTPSNINSSLGDHGSPVFSGLLADNGPIVRVAGGSLIGQGFWGSTQEDYGADAIRFRPYMLSMDAAFNNDGISYRSQVQSNGWMQAVQNGNTSGTTGQSLRLEALQVWSPRAGVSVCYTAYVQNTGWQSEKCDGDMAGTVGQSLRMEAVKIRLAAKPTLTNGVMYNAYLQGIGWQGWQKDNAMAGTTGQSRRIEAIAIKLY